MKLSKIKIITAILLCAAILPSTACTSTDSGKDRSFSQSPDSQQTEAQKAPDKVENDSSQPPSESINVDVYNEKINYYMQLVETLQSEMLELKQGQYINESQYQSKIDELENTVSTLLERIDAMASGKPSNGSGNTMDPVSKKGEFEYKVTDGGATITKYIGKAVDVEIPRVIDSYTVTAIGESAFQNSNVQSVVIPDTVRLIDWFAFAGCTSLKSITIPSSVLSVQYGAFDRCQKSMKIYCAKGSYIEAYALSWGMNAEAK